MFRKSRIGHNTLPIPDIIIIKINGPLLCPNLPD